jgi:predicted amidohydrolase
MTSIRIALANIEIPQGPQDALERALGALAQAASAGAHVVCFPEAYVPGIHGALPAQLT